MAPPLSGVTKSTLHTTRSASGIEGVLFQAITSYASLNRGDIVTSAINQLQSIDAYEKDAFSQRLITSVKDILTAKNQSYAHRFGGKVTVKNNGKMTIDYLGINLNAGISDLNIKQPIVSFNKAKAKLFDLKVLKEQQAKSTLFNTRFELIANFDKDKKEQRSLINNLETLAQEIGINVIGLPSPQSIASRIEQLESAA